MLYYEYISKAKRLCIAIDDYNNTAYLLPDYRYLLRNAKMDIAQVTDFEGLTEEIVAENLKLEVAAYNVRHNPSPALALFAKEALLEVFSPMQQQQNDLIASLLAYIKEKGGLPQAQSSTDETDELSSKILQLKENADFSKKN